LFSFPILNRVDGFIFAASAVKAL